MNQRPQDEPTTVPTPDAGGGAGVARAWRTQVVDLLAWLRYGDAPRPIDATPPADVADEPLESALDEARARWGTASVHAGRRVARRR